MDLLELYKKLQITYKELQDKYDSKQRVNGLMTPMVQGMLSAYSTKHYK